MSLFIHFGQKIIIQRILLCLIPCQLCWQKVLVQEKQKLQKTLQIFDIVLIADKTYVDGEIKNDLAAKDIQLHTPIKLTKTKKELTEEESLYSKIINSFRQ